MMRGVIRFPSPEYSVQEDGHAREAVDMGGLPSGGF